MASEPTVDNSDERTDTPEVSPDEVSPDSSTEMTAPESALQGTETAAEPTEDAAEPVKKTTRKRAAKKATAKKTTAKRTTAKKAVAAETAAADAAPDTDQSDPEPDSAAGEAGEDQPAPAKRTRRGRKATAPVAEREPATESETADADEDEEDAAGESSKAAADATQDPSADTPQGEVTETASPPTFGLVFQAPEPVAPRRRRATSAAGAPTSRPAEDPAATDAPTADEPSADTGSADDAEIESSTDETSSEGTTRRSRRRGGRGRRSRTGDSSADDAADQSGSGTDSTGDTTDATDAQGPDTPGGDSAAASQSDSTDESSTSTSSRRRRRRRRGSSSDSDESRGARAREEVTALRGSTRLEAKKQRRREGREAGRRRQIITEAEFLARRESVERVMVVREREGKTQIGVLEDDVLVEHYVSRETGASMIGNVYLGRVQNVLPSMEAAFVDIGKGRNAVLYAGEVNWDAAGLEGNVPKRIENALTSGDTVLVQVTKDPIGHKGARLTSQVSLPGRFLVYVPEASMTGISRKLPDTERSRLKAILKRIVPDDAGVIVRTAAEGATEEELTADIERLTKAWERITTKAEKAGKRKGGAPALLHGEPDLTVKVIRDVFNEDFTSLVVAGDKAFTEVSDYLEDVAPDLAQRLSKWTGEKDLFTQYRVDEQLAKALDRKVWLPSGGSLVIDRTEAMTVVDVNTGKFVGSGGNLEETVTKNNIEAAEEIVRQLRLRDIGGIIVIDFIDMVLESNRDLVVRRLLECLGRDRTKHQVAEVTSLGLVQMTRKRVGSGLLEVFSESCSHCNGRGLIVHSDPIDQPAGDDGSSSGRGRGRGRGGNGGANGNRGARSADAEPENNGPTAAQIAAAAHAAALKAVAAASSMPEAQSATDDAPGGASEATAPIAEDVTADTEATDAPESAGALETQSETLESPDAAPSEDVTAEADQTDADDTASSESSELKAGGHRSDTGAQVQVSESVDAPPHTPESKAAEPEPEPVPAARPRRRRGRVVAQAGPPGQAEVRVLTADADE